MLYSQVGMINNSATALQFGDVHKNRSVHLSELSSFTNRLSNMITWPNFSERKLPGSCASGEILIKNTGVGVSSHQAATTNTAAYRMDENFKLAFLFNNNY